MIWGQFLKLSVWFISVFCAVVKPDYRDSGNYYKAFITTDQVFSMALI